MVWHYISASQKSVFSPESTVSSIKGGTLAACGQSPGIVLMRSHDTHTRALCARETGAHVRIARVKQERTPALRAGEPVTCEGHSIFRGTWIFGHALWVPRCSRKPWLPAGMRWLSPDDCPFGGIPGFLYSWVGNADFMLGLRATKTLQVRVLSIGWATLPLNFIVDLLTQRCSKHFVSVHGTFSSLLNILSRKH